MVLCEAFAIRKLIIAGYSEQEFSWCYKGTVMGPARMKLMQGRGEQHELKRKKYLTCYKFDFFFFKIRKRLILSDKGQLDWKKMYFKLIRCYPRKEQYGDTLQLCRHCHILSWKVRGAGGTNSVGTQATGHSVLPLIAACLGCYSSFACITSCSPIS